MSPFFRYHTKDVKGADRDGSIDALDENDAVKKLQEQGLVVIFIEMAKDDKPDVAKEQVLNIPVEENKHSLTKKCPSCAEEIKYDAIKCRYCGEILSDKQSAQSISTKISRDNSVLRVLGLIAFIVGFGIFIYYWRFFDTTVSVPTMELFGQTIGGGQVNNIGLMQDKQNGLLFGGIVTVLGFICSLVGEYLHRKH